MVRGLSLNGLAAPAWMGEAYGAIQAAHPALARPVVMQSRTDKLVVQRCVGGV